jgi:hypothetical protein
MSISGRLSEFSLGEVFQLLERGQKTGLLTIRVAHSPAETLQNFYLWFNQGQIVAAANRLDNKGLVSLLYQRDWLGEQGKGMLLEAFRSNRALGLYLKCQKLLNAEQLKLLFYAQVIRQVCSIFQFSEGWFSFEAKTELPLAEMTGLSAVPLNVTLEGLRALKDWRALSKKLPDPNSAITSLITGNPQIKINPLEWQVWEFANGTEPLTVIAEQLQLPLEKIQQIVFRLIIVGLIEEIPLVIAKPDVVPEIEQQNPDLLPANNKSISQSFLHNLAGFLGRRVAH